ncbi:glycosyltransferase family 2 protein [Bryobacter aggregatus]|uniref:glycosyltransferase family 2 protein n=1 Tax=Bryobacter aggregatus TaxID=360054 RepID=UPI0004E0F07B|nr:glycosyltransferase family 2 protein [Bryobacter aggregatus]
MSASIGAVIVTWNSADEIAACIEALDRAGLREIVVVDNGSTDNTRNIAASYPQVKLLYYPENLGFSGGVNRGVMALASEFALILNPDTVVQGGLSEMAAAAGGGAAGGMLSGLDGALQSGFAIRRLPTPATLIFETLGFNRLFPGNPVNRRYRCAGFDASKAQEVEQPPGAFLMVKRDIFERLGGMDEQFWPVWFEDVDFCARLLDHGFSIRYTPLAQAKHAGGRSIRKIEWSFKELTWYGSLLRYAAKRFGWCSRCLVGLAVAAASVLKMFSRIIFRPESARTPGVYVSVLRLALVSLIKGRVDTLRPGRQVEGPDHIDNA